MENLLSFEQKKSNDEKLKDFINDKNFDNPQETFDIFLQTKSTSINPYTHLYNDYLYNLKNFEALDFETQYITALIDVLNNGNQSTDRTGTGTKRLQGKKFIIDVSDNKLPILKGKKMFAKSAFVEAVWMLKGDKNIEFLNAFGVKYWDCWADADGNLGPIYGVQMRNFDGIDQFKEAIKLIKISPDSRRIIISLWNPKDLPLMKLCPCHIQYQFCIYYKNPNDTVPVMDMHITQRSADAFIGVPYDFILFATIMRIMGHLVNLPCNKIHYTCNDFHIYNNHEEQVKQYLANVVENKDNVIFSESTFNINIDNNDVQLDIDEYLKLIIDSKFECFQVNNYKSYPFIKAPIAV